MSVIDLGPPCQSGIPGVPSMPMGAVQITPSDDDTYPRPVMVWCNTAGTVVVLPWNNGVGETVPYVMPAGSVIPVCVKMVLATGTTSEISLNGSF